LKAIAKLSQSITGFILEKKLTFKMNKRPDFGIIDFDKIRKRKKRDLTELEKQEIHEAFKLFDTDNDDKIDYHELKVALRALGFDIKKPDVQKVMADYDVENTGKLTIEDFNEIGIILKADYIRNVSLDSRESIFFCTMRL
jgi:Ca2+-binding EF-hand superfamily protein